MQIIKLLIAGDFNPHQRIEELLKKSDFKSIFNDFIDVFQGNDLNIVNLETPLTNSKVKQLKIGPHQSAIPRSIEILEYAKVGLVTMANNHIMDYGVAGAIETIQLCNKSGIATVGIGENSVNAAEHYSSIINGKTIAILNVADAEFLTVPGELYQANSLDAVKNFNNIKKTRSQSDYVIMIVHGGNEFYSLPSPRIKQLYRFFIDAGADAVISHHTHHFSGYEIYNQKPIFYGLGNFIYDWPERVNTCWNKGYVIKLMLNEKIDFEIIPLKQNNEIPGVFRLNKEEANDFDEKLLLLNNIIADDCKLELEFQKYCRSVKPSYDSYIEPSLGRVYSFLRKRKLFPNLMSKRKRLLILNLIRCESHRDVLINMLGKY